MEAFQTTDNNGLTEMPNMNMNMVPNTMNMDNLHQQTQSMMGQASLPFIAGLSSFNCFDKSQTITGLPSIPPMNSIHDNNNDNNNNIHNNNINMLDPQKFNISSINTMNAGSMTSIPANTMFNNGFQQNGALSMSRRRHHGLNQATPNSPFSPFQPLPPSLMPNQNQNQNQDQSQSVYIRDNSPNTDSTQDGTVTINSGSNVIKRYDGEIKPEFNVTDFSATPKREIKMDFNVTNFAATSTTSTPSLNCTKLSSDDHISDSNGNNGNNGNVVNNYQPPTITLMTTASNSNSNSNSNFNFNSNSIGNLDLSNYQLQFPSLLPNFPDLTAPMFGDINNDNMTMDDNTMTMNMDLGNQNKGDGDAETGVVFHQCPSCPRKFQHRSNLSIHQKIHSSSAFICNFCGKKFARHSNLRQHTRVHTNERPFKCKYCPKSFKQQHSLVDHVRIHTGEKPHKCEFCEKAFAARCNLMVHRRIHTGERPYKCDECHKQYASKSGYNSHRKKYHSN